MTADRKALPRAGLLAAAALALVGSGVALGAGAARAADPAALPPAALDQHAAAVARVVQSQVTSSILPDDRKRAQQLLTVLLETRRTTRSDVARREMRWLTRRDAALRGIQNNLTLLIGRAEPERMQTLVREALAVFDPVLDLQLGYTRQDSYRRERIGTVRPKVFAPFFPATAGGEPIFDDPLPPGVNAGRRINLCTATPQAAGCAGGPPATAPTIRALEMYYNVSTASVQDNIVANAGRSTLNHGHPLQQTNVTIGLTQELPWGGSVTLTDRTVQQKIYYENRHYWEDGQFTSNLSGTFNLPLPYTKGSGLDSPANVAIRNAGLAHGRAEHVYQDLLNQILRDVDVAYFETVRGLQRLAAAVENDRRVRELKARHQRIMAQNPGLITRYQEAQVDSELVGSGLQVEQALQTYLTTSIALAELIGEPDARTGSAIYLPYGYDRELDVKSVATMDQAMAAARKSRPDFFIARIDREIAGVGMALAENQARPDIRLTGSASVSENGSTYGYADPLQSHFRLIRPDSTSQTYGLTYTYPWGNRAAEAVVDVARLTVEDREVVIRVTEARVRQEIASDLAAVQSARARLLHAGNEVRILRAAYESLQRDPAVAEDQIIQAGRRLLEAEGRRIEASLDNRESETRLLYHQGIIATALPRQTSPSAFDSRRLAVLADAGHLRYFGPRPGHQRQ